MKIKVGRICACNDCRNIRNHLEARNEIKIAMRTKPVIGYIGTSWETLFVNDWSAADKSKRFEARIR